MREGKEKHLARDHNSEWASFRAIKPLPLLQQSHPIPRLILGLFGLDLEEVNGSEEITEFLETVSAVVEWALVCDMGADGAKRCPAVIVSG